MNCCDLISYKWGGLYREFVTALCGVTKHALKFKNRAAVLLSPAIVLFLKAAL